MKKFILRSSLFISPFLLIYFLNTQVYVDNQGDLARLGYLYHDASPSRPLIKNISLPGKAIKVSDLNIDSITPCDVFVIGDSFSDQGNLGYVNYLANDNLDVIHFDRYFADNPIQMTIELLNGGFFDSVKPKYIVLQSIERMFVPRCQSINYDSKFTHEQIKDRIKSENTISGNEEPFMRNLPLFKEDIVKIPLTNIEYLFKSKPQYSQIYKIASNNDSLFTGNPNNILVYQEDVDNLIYKNDSNKIVSCNTVLNKINTLLAEKNIKLIVLISPDKYDLYYPYFKNKTNYKKPIFFDYFHTLEKEYKYVNAMEILSDEVEKQKDVYYYDDTHWSFKGADIIARQIKKMILESESGHQSEPANGE